MPTSEQILVKLDERTKYIKETLDKHIIDTKTHSTDIASLKTNMSWVKRFGIGIPSLTAIVAGIWKGMG
ncbi:hypothetical protein DRO66_11635 [Candidatus Bathyarchaeota archaeon]|nr:MAG: hypothetical protein DRO66_11635 [Candidatus Bathyarchaeota archaeon]